MPKMLPAKRQRSSENTQCSLCGVEIRARGLALHLKKCEKQDQEQHEDEELAGIVRTAKQKGGLSNVLKC